MLQAGTIPLIPEIRCFVHEISAASDHLFEFQLEPMEFFSVVTCPISVAAPGALTDAASTSGAFACCFKDPTRPRPGHAKQFTPKAKVSHYVNSQAARGASVKAGAAMP